MWNPGRKWLMRRPVISFLAAVSLTITLTAAASADSQAVAWSGGGQVLYAGLSPDSSLPTTTESEFKLNRDGSIRSVSIKTSNEFFAGVLASGPGGSAVTECRDHRGSNACEQLESLLAGVQIASIHDSKVTLSRVTEGKVQVPVMAPGGQVMLTMAVVSGAVRGELHGQLTLSNSSGGAAGTAGLRIGRGSTATYACFGGNPSQPVPMDSMQPCIDGSGGQLLPILFNVHDSGGFKIGPGSGSMADILGLKGRVQVSAQADMLQQQFGGEILIAGATAQLEADDETEPNGPTRDEDDEDGDRDRDKDRGHGNGDNQDERRGERNGRGAEGKNEDDGRGERRRGGDRDSD